MGFKKNQYFWHLIVFPNEIECAANYFSGRKKMPGIFAIFINLFLHYSSSALFAIYCMMHDKFRYGSIILPMSYHKFL